MDQEFNSLMSHNTGILVPNPKNREKVIGGMWCLNKKRNEFGKVYRYKARWVVFGNHQEHMLHSFDTWSSVGRNETFKAMLSLVINLNMHAYQFAIETAFLHGKMDTIVYVKQVKGYEQLNRENWVWRLNKSLYGTRKAPRMWKEKLTEALSKFGFASTLSDESLFITTNATLMLHIHVDNGFLIGKLEQEIMTFLTSSNKQLKLKFTKNPTQDLVYTIMWNKSKIQLSQTDLILKLLDQNDMEDCKPVKTPCNGNLLQEIESIEEPIKTTKYQQIIGSLNYLAQHTRPDIMFTTSSLFSFFPNPRLLSKLLSLLSLFSFSFSFTLFSFYHSLQSIRTLFFLQSHHCFVSQKALFYIVYYTLSCYPPLVLTSHRFTVSNSSLNKQHIRAKTNLGGSQEYDGCFE
ncbi:hypothetical protein O181_090910 [Austropuccinia psidii MF-1]|uniref:Reverse transcriptase Ty1/copia-type domain-containing protein n=1 Tax=Austropuccinia psidii MF-1 TaxID=1389203 RepID=A0A9Q3P7J5_9BASI|nr:hypothetical protein [Austropuccinia psidii MF-1]